MWPFECFGKRLKIGVMPFWNLYMLLLRLEYLCAGQSCDNLQGNGDILRQTLILLVRLSDTDLADWIVTNCTVLCCVCV
jgi:hypothetical protein